MESREAFNAWFKNQAQTQQEMPTLAEAWQACEAWMKSQQFDPVVEGMKVIDAIVAKAQAETLKKAGK